MAFRVTEHPVLPIPTAEEAAAMGEEKWLALMKRRKEIIAQEKDDPIRYQFEPPIWKICDGVMQMPWVDPAFGQEVRDRLKLPQIVKVLLVLGGNRASKTRYAGRTAQKVLNGTENQEAWLLHTNHQNSVDNHQRLMWDLMPKELKITIRSQTTYISYTQKYGFSDDKFVLPNKSMASFRNYEQKEITVEGGDINFGWLDEKAPPDIVETMTLRIATRDGRLLTTFTPIWGFSGTVKLFLDGAKLLKESVAVLLPMDGGPADEKAALEMEDCLEWVRGKGEGEKEGEGEGENLPTNHTNHTKGEKNQRKFARVPRVLTCFKKERAVVYFHVSDNPFAPPKNILAKMQGATREYIRERWYGVASKVQAARFPMFSTDVHVVPANQIPKRGTNFQIVDPCGARNFFCHWLRRTPEDYYFYREWPGNYNVPGFGVPEEWAKPDGRKPDGKRGKGQDTFGFGLLDYKREFARLERWTDFRKYGDDHGGHGGTEERNATSDIEHRTSNNQHPTSNVQQDRELTVAEWREEHGAEEKIRERLMDSRFASSPRPEQDRPVTLLEEFDEIGLYFMPTPGDVLTDGIQKINDLLAYDRNKPVNYMNRPHLYVCEDCVNTIFALQTWTGDDGAHGATKDPIDCLRYAVLADLQHEEEEEIRGQRTDRRGQKRYY
jgi:phage terminase large subunit-like protein